MRLVLVGICETIYLGQSAAGFSWWHARIAMVVVLVVWREPD
jgi:hypothetical protein